MRPTVCVIDDDRSVRRALQRLLQSAKYHVLTFASADEFLQHAFVKKPACLLIDIQMPGTTGASLYNRLCRSGCTVPIVLISGRADVHVITRQTGAAPVSFLSKPFEDVTLLEAVDLATADERRRRAALLPTPAQVKG